MIAWAGLERLGGRARSDPHCRIGPEGALAVGERES